MRKLFFALLVTVIVARCSKNKCEGCEATSNVYIDDVLQSRTVSKIDCGAKPGTTVKRAPTAYEKTYTAITTIKCY